MEYRRLGKSGLKVSALSFGSWVTFGNQIEDNTAETLMKTAYDNGVNFFDNAEIYADGKAEEIMGNIIKKFGWKRDSFVVSSKVYWGGKLPNQFGLSRKHVVEACHAALIRFKMDYLDLYFCHRADRETPIEETVFTMNDLIKQGKILYWGTSEWSADAIMQAHAIAKENHLIGPTMEQPQYNMFHRERFELEYRRLYHEIGLGTTIWSPLASGILTNKYAKGEPKDSRMNQPELQWLRDFMASSEGQSRIEKTKLLANIAEEIGTSVSKMALAWCLKNENVNTVILGATKNTQLIENLDSLTILPLLTEEVMAKIEVVLGNKPKFPVYG